MANPFDADQFLDRGGCEEGNYTVYAWLWDTAVCPWVPTVIAADSSINTRETLARIIWVTDFDFIDMATAVVVNVPGVVDAAGTYTQYHHHSVYGTYHAAIDPWPRQNLRIYRDGVQLNIFALGGADRWRGLVVSPTGHYVVALATIGGVEFYRCWRGA